MTLGTVIPRTLLTWIGIAVLSGMGAVFAWNWTAASANWVEHTLVAQRQFSMLLSSAQDLELGQRGYLLTNDTVYLEPYERAKSSIDKIYSDLAVLVEDNDEQVATLKRIRPLIDQRITIIEDSLAHMRAGRTDEALAVPKSGAGKAVMDQLRSEIETAQNKEISLYNVRQDAFDRQKFWLLAALLSTLIASAGLALLSLIREKERIASLEQSSKTLALVNRSLERRVTERTEELAIERDRAEAEKERAEGLLRDVTHRIGNTLALVVGFLNLHIRHASDPMSIKTLTGARSRVHAIASAQRRINVTNDLDLVRIDSLVESVIGDLAATMNDDNIEIKVDIPPLLAAAQVATSLCVLTQEFVMNSTKHAYREGDKGLITVQLAKADKGSVLKITDDGRGMADDDDDGDGEEADEKDGREGLGAQIAKLLSRQFNGEISYQSVTSDAERPGTQVIVTLPDLKLTVAADEPHVDLEKAS
ncbi:MAG: histidine kinase [Hyphomicrobium sp.]|nr:MAG: histidine kinase [Hyphomicrobium sp.]PPD01929.1 MAG: histidine kinase [Hyphomicrobium sp.]